MFECDICNKMFDTFQHLNQHINKKNKCNTVTDFQCSVCNKYLRTKTSLIYHNKNICIISENNDIIAIDESTNQSTLSQKAIKTINDCIKTIVKSSIDTKDKIDLILDYNKSLTKNKIKVILSSSMNLEDKIKVLLVTPNPQNPSSITINNNSNNTINDNSNNTTNILVNNFGKEDISYLDSNYFNNLLLNQHIEKGYVQLIKDIYLNKEHPENGTVKIENINNKYAMVYNDGKWDAILKYELRELLHKKNYTILKMHYDKLKKSMSVPKREETYTFLKRDDTSDPHMMYVIDKIILLFYNEDEKIISV
jgi:hypothetical protein